MGKTTLAKAVAEQEAARYELGVHLVDLTRAEQGAEVPAALATQLGFPGFEALLDAPTEQPALVIVDNCEHVLDDAARSVHALLEACRSPTVLATSRTPLDVPGESIVSLGPLALPRAGQDPATSPAVQLFLQRSADAGADPLDDELDTVTELCRVLDGVPLAIELAAARSRVLRASELLAGLTGDDHDLDLLRRPRFRGPTRHRSLRETITWSFDLLGADDRTFLERLSVFTGPFTAADAAAVAGHGDPDRALDRLDGLVDASLLMVEPVGDVTHYRLLELVRASARERLVASGAWEPTWLRFIDHVVGWSVRFAAASTSGWHAGTLGSLLPRTDSHLAALRWCVDHDDTPQRSFLLVATLWGVVHQGRVDDVAPLAEATLGRWHDPDEPGWADAVATAATCRYLRGDPAGAIELARSALPHAGGSSYAPATLRRLSAHASCALGKLDAAVELLAEAIEHARGVAPALAMEMAATRAELLAATGAPLDEPLALVRAVGEEAAASGAVVNSIWAQTVEASLLARVDTAAAEHAALQVLQRSRLASYPACESAALQLLAELSIERGDTGGALALITELVDGLVTRGAESELRNALRLTSLVLGHLGREQVAADLAATAASLPSLSIFAPPGHERLLVPAHHHGTVLPRRDASLLMRHELRSALDQSPPTITDTRDGGELDDVTHLMEHRGDTWTITFGGTEISVRHGKGVSDLARLMRSPGTEIHCLDLAGAGVREPDAGDAIDTEARRRYEQRIIELHADLDEAEADHDRGRAEQLQHELDTLVEHLTAALGLGGTARRQGGTVERARSAVTHRLRSTVRRLGELHPELGRHLEVSVRTGVYCSYEPERPTSWTIRHASDGIGGG